MSPCSGMKVLAWTLRNEDLDEPFLASWRGMDLNMFTAIFFRKLEDVQVNPVVFKVDHPNAKIKTKPWGVV
jgi:hypothetical protein